MRYYCHAIVIAIALCADFVHAQEHSGQSLGGIRSSPLLNGLQAYWQLEENSSTRYDQSFNANHLSGANAGGAVTGVIGNAVSLATTGQYLFRASNSTLQIGQRSVEFTCWVKLVSLPGSGAVHTIFSKLQSGSFEYACFIENSSGTIRFVWQARQFNNVTNQTLRATTFGTPATNTWYFVDTYYDYPNGTMGIAVNNTAFDTATMTGGIRASTQNFCIGQDSGGDWLLGYVDQFGIWGRLLTGTDAIGNTERELLYNNGLGINFPKFTASLPGIQRLKVDYADSLLLIDDSGNTLLAD